LLTPAGAETVRAHALCGHAGAFQQEVKLVGQHFRRSNLSAPLSGQDAAVFYLGAYTGAVPDAVLRKLTVDAIFAATFVARPFQLKRALLGCLVGFSPKAKCARLIPAQSSQSDERQRGAHQQSDRPLGAGATFWSGQNLFRGGRDGDR
jgi:hypothetical protein